MSVRKRTRKVYYHVVKGSHYLFADERDKKKLLDILFAVEKEEEWLIYAFCIMDNDAYFVIEASGAGSVHRGMQRTANLFLSYYRTSPACFEKGEAALKCGTLRELDSLGEIADCSRQIHRIPLEQGYVGQIGDYWWSSYITYTGSYDWELVDCRILSMYFSANQEAARRRLIKYHQ